MASRAALWMLPIVAALGCAASSGTNGTPNPTGSAGSSVFGGSGTSSVGNAGSNASLASGGAGRGGVLPVGGAGGIGVPPTRGGTGGAMAAAGNGGVAGMTVGGGAGTGGTAGGGAPITYPMLDGTKIGSPVQVSNGFTLAEGPLWDPCGHRLLFTDVQGGGGGGTIHALAADGMVSVFMMNTGNANGIAFDLDGSLILAQMGGNPGHVARRDKAGMVTKIDPAGSMLHTPDDVVVRSDGTIYFSDGDFPPIGSLNFGALPVYGIKPGTSMLVNGGTVAGPNGVELSPDEKTLYVDAYFEGSVVKFAVAADGSLTKGAALASGLSSPDSLCLDAAGNLYVGVSSGLHVMRPDGMAVKDIPIQSSSGTTNCTFGGEDGKTLYITAWTTLWKVEGMPIPGLDWVVNTKRLTCM